MITLGEDLIFEVVTPVELNVGDAEAPGDVVDFVYVPGPPGPPGAAALPAVLDLGTPFDTNGA